MLGDCPGHHNFFGLWVDARLLESVNARHFGNMDLLYHRYYDHMVCRQHIVLNVNSCMDRRKGI